MAIDVGLDDPAAMEALSRAINIVDDVVDSLHDELGGITYSDESEVYRLARALPPGPISLDRTIMVAVEAARGALDQISYILHHNAPTSAIALHTLLRAALVGSGRTVFALLPSDPSVRLRNARVLIAQEGMGFTQALDRYARFKSLSGLRPDAQYLATAQEQNAAIQQGRRPPGDGVVMQGAAEAIAAALAAMPEYPNGNRESLQEHVTWLWNTYSGAAHTHAWPRLLPGYYSRGFPVCVRAAALRDAMLMAAGYMLSPPSGRPAVRWLPRGAGRCGGASGRWPGGVAAAATSAGRTRAGCG